MAGISRVSRLRRFWRKWLSPRVEFHDLMAVPVGRLEPKREEPIPDNEPCDRCNTPHAKGRWVITLPTGKHLFLCNHHYHKFRWHIGSKAYEVKEVK